MSQPVQYGLIAAIVAVGLLIGADILRSALNSAPATVEEPAKK